MRKLTVRSRARRGYIDSLEKRARFEAEVLPHLDVTHREGPHGPFQGHGNREKMPALFHLL